MNVIVWKPWLNNKIDFVKQRERGALNVEWYVM